MKRRDFTALLASAALAAPLSAWAQQSRQTRRIGILMGLADSEPRLEPRQLIDKIADSRRGARMVEVAPNRPSRHCSTTI